MFEEVRIVCILVVLFNIVFSGIVMSVSIFLGVSLGVSVMITICGRFKLGNMLMGKW